MNKIDESSKRNLFNNAVEEQNEKLRKIYQKK